MNNVLNQNVNVIKTSKVSQYLLPGLIISAPNGSNFLTILDFFISC